MSQTWAVVYTVVFGVAASMFAARLFRTVGRKRWLWIAVLVYVTGLALLVLAWEFMAWMWPSIPSGR